MAWNPETMKKAREEAIHKKRINKRKLNSMKLKLFLPDTIVFGD